MACRRTVRPVRTLCRGDRHRRLGPLAPPAQRLVRVRMGGARGRIRAHRGVGRRVRGSAAVRGIRLGAGRPRRTVRSRSAARPDAVGRVSCDRGVSRLRRSGCICVRYCWRSSSAGDSRDAHRHANICLERTSLTRPRHGYKRTTCQSSAKMRSSARHQHVAWLEPTPAQNDRH